MYFFDQRQTIPDDVAHFSVYSRTVIRNTDPELQELLRGGVDPVEVLDHEDQRLLARHPEQGVQRHDLRVGEVIGATLGVRRGGDGASGRDRHPDRWAATGWRWDRLEWHRIRRTWPKLQKARAPD